MIHYKLEYGSLFLLDEYDQVLDEVKTPCALIDFSPAGAIMIKHGDKRRIDKVYKDWTDRYINSGFPEMAANLCVVVLSGISVYHLNRMIDTTGYISVLLKKLKVCPEGWELNEKGWTHSDPTKLTSEVTVHFGQAYEQGALDPTGPQTRCLMR